MSFHFSILRSNISLPYHLRCCPYWTTITISLQVASFSISQDVTIAKWTRPEQFVPFVEQLRSELRSEAQDHPMRQKHNKYHHLHGSRSLVPIYLKMVYSIFWLVQVITIPEILALLRHYYQFQILLHWEEPLVIYEVFQELLWKICTQHNWARMKSLSKDNNFWFLLHRQHLFCRRQAVWSSTKVPVASRPDWIPHIPAHHPFTRTKDKIIAFWLSNVVEIFQDWSGIAKVLQQLSHWHSFITST